MACNILYLGFGGQFHLILYHSKIITDPSGFFSFSIPNLQGADFDLIQEFSKANDELF